MILECPPQYDFAALVFHTMTTLISLIIYDIIKVFLTTTPDEIEMMEDDETSESDLFTQEESIDELDLNQHFEQFLQLVDVIHEYEDGHDKLAAIVKECIGFKGRITFDDYINRLEEYIDQHTKYEQV
jgi:hypothetical protein